MIEKIEKTYAIFSRIFEGIEGNTRDFVPIVKLLAYNRLSHSVSIHKILDTYPEEAIHRFGMKKTPGERSIYRTIERVGKCFPILLSRYQKFIKDHGAYR